MEAMAENNTFICNERNTINLSNVTLAEQMIVTDGDVLMTALITPSLGLLGIVGNLVFLCTIIRLSDTQSGLNTYLCHLAHLKSFSLQWLYTGFCKDCFQQEFCLSHMKLSPISAAQSTYFPSTSGISCPSN